MAALRHVALALCAFSIVAGTGAWAISSFGSPHAGAPRAVVALAAPHEGQVASLRGKTEPADPSMDMVAGAVLAEAEVLVPDEAAIGTADPFTPTGLAPAPLAGLVLPGPSGPLPTIGPGGLRPSAAYARPFTANGKPQIAIMIGGLGLNAAVTDAAITRLPPEVTLAFAPHARDLQTWVNKARAFGHEVVLEVPMEPFDIGAEDAGPNTLLAAANAEENQRRLDWVMSRTTGYFAVTNYLGGRFVTVPEAVDPMVSILRARGISFLQSGVSQRSAVGAAARRAGVTFAAADRVIDASANAEAIDEQLLRLEALALERGYALGVGFAYPVTVEQIALWARGLARRGYQLAPASAVMETSFQQSRRG
jgi:polysaccharide deacetylase 2 family uncharacterized protein YibQ